MGDGEINRVEGPREKDTYLVSELKNGSEAANFFGMNQQEFANALTAVSSTFSELIQKELNAPKPPFSGTGATNPKEVDIPELFIATNHFFNPLFNEEFGNFLKAYNSTVRERTQTLGWFDFIAQWRADYNESSHTENGKRLRELKNRVGAIKSEFDSLSALMQGDYINCTKQTLILKLKNAEREKKDTSEALEKVLAGQKKSEPASDEEKEARKKELQSAQQKVDEAQEKINKISLELSLREGVEGEGYTAYQVLERMKHAVYAFREVQNEFLALVGNEKALSVAQYDNSFEIGYRDKSRQKQEAQTSLGTFEDPRDPKTRLDHYLEQALEPPHSKRLLPAFINLKKNLNAEIKAMNQAESLFQYHRYYDPMGNIISAEELEERGLKTESFLLNDIVITRKNKIAVLVDAEEDELKVELESIEDAQAKLYWFQSAADLLYRGVSLISKTVANLIFQSPKAKALRENAALVQAQINEFPRYKARVISALHGSVLDRAVVEAAKKRERVSNDFALNNHIKKRVKKIEVAVEKLKEKSTSIFTSATEKANSLNEIKQLEEQKLVLKEGQADYFKRQVILLVRHSESMQQGVNSEAQSKLQTELNNSELDAPLLSALNKLIELHQDGKPYVDFLVDAQSFVKENIDPLYPAILFAMAANKFSAQNLTSKDVDILSELANKLPVEQKQAYVSLLAPKLVESLESQPAENSAQIIALFEKLKKDIPQENKDLKKMQSYVAINAKVERLSTLMDKQLNELNAALAIKQNKPTVRIHLERVEEVKVEGGLEKIENKRAKDPKLVEIQLRLLHQEAKKLLDEPNVLNTHKAQLATHLVALNAAGLARLTRIGLHAKQEKNVAEISADTQRFAQQYKLEYKPVVRQTVMKAVTNAQDEKAKQTLETLDKDLKTLNNAITDDFTISDTGSVVGWLESAGKTMQGLVQEKVPTAKGLSQVQMDFLHTVLPESNITVQAKQQRLTQYLDLLENYIKAGSEAKQGHKFENKAFAKAYYDTLGLGIAYLKNLKETHQGTMVQKKVKAKETVPLLATGHLKKIDVLIEQAEQYQTKNKAKIDSYKAEKAQAQPQGTPSKAEQKGYSRPVSSEETKAAQLANVPQTNAHSKKTAFQEEPKEEPPPTKYP